MAHTTTEGEVEVTIGYLIRFDLVCESATNEELAAWAMAHKDEVSKAADKKMEDGRPLAEISVGWLDDDREVLLAQEIMGSRIKDSSETMVDY